MLLNNPKKTLKKVFIAAVVISGTALVYLLLTIMESNVPEVNLTAYLPIQQFFIEISSHPKSQMLIGSLIGVFFFFSLFGLASYLALKHATQLLFSILGACYLLFSWTQFELFHASDDLLQHILLERIITLIPIASLIWLHFSPEAKFKLNPEPSLFNILLVLNTFTLIFVYFSHNITLDLIVVAFLVIIILGTLLYQSLKAVLNERIGYRYYLLSWLFPLVFLLTISYYHYTGEKIGFNYYLVFNVSLMIHYLFLAIALLDALEVEKKNQHIQNIESIKHLDNYYELFSGASEGLFTATEEGDVSDANPAFLNMFGYNQEDLTLNLNISKHYVNPIQRTQIIKTLHIKGSIKDYEVQFKNRFGELFWGAVTARWVEQNGKFVLKSSIRDINSQKVSEQRLDFIHNHHANTGLINKQEFCRQSQVMINSQAEQSLLIVYIGIEQANLIKCEFGNVQADKFIYVMADELKKQSDRFQLMANYDDYNFNLLMLEKNQHILEQLVTKLEDVQIAHNENVMHSRIKIGAIRFKANRQEADMLLDAAFNAYYTSKSHVNVVDLSLHNGQQQQQVMGSIASIQSAISENRFVLYQQAISPLSKTEGHHYEILIRMLDEKGDIVPPFKFLPIAEKYGLMWNIDQWVIDNYCHWLSLHPAHNRKLNRASINLSGDSLGQKNLIDFITLTIKKYQIDASKLCFEITETMAMTNLERTITAIEKLKKLGIEFSLDDFGSGYSSYSYLKNLNIDYLKIDGVFIKDLHNNPTDIVMVQSIVSVAHAMNLKTIGEFVENDKIKQELARLNVDYVQGYGIHKPELLVDPRQYL